MVIMSQEGKDPKDYISFSNEMKYVINSVVPGELFSDVVPSARQFSQIYRSKAFREIKESYQSDMWTIFGTFFVYFGWFLGIILMFITAFVLAAIFKIISKLKTRYKIFLQFWFLFATYNLLISYGFGFWILVYIIYPFIDMAVILVILYIFSGRFLSPVIPKKKMSSENVELGFQNSN